MSKIARWGGAPYQIVETEDGEILTRRFYYRGTYYPNNPKRVQTGKGLQNYTVIGGPYWSSAKVSRLIALIEPVKTTIKIINNHGKTPWFPVYLLSSNPINAKFSTNKSRKQEELDFLQQWGKASGEFHLENIEGILHLVVESPGNKEEGC